MTITSTEDLVESGVKFSGKTTAYFEFELKNKLDNRSLGISVC